MGRGVSSGGGQSSLGYLFGSTEDEPKAASTGRASVAQSQSVAPENLPPAGLARKVEKPESSVSTTTQKVESSTTPEADAATVGRSSNNYHRAEGQNAGNFITDRPSTKVHSVPGGGSSLGYLFGSNDK